MSEAEHVDAAVELARSMLQGDGYDVELEGFEKGELRLRIVAGPDACVDCLVPKHMLSNLVAANLPPELDGTQISLTYPPGSIHA